jgi:TolB-like protein/Tfp pilus assembly protein PilF
VSFLAELKRRNVIRVGIAYVVGSWLLVQAADLVFDLIGAEDWILRAVAAILALGFVPAILFAWAFEITPEGIKKEKDVIRTESVTHQTAKKLNIATMLLLVAAIGLLALDRFIPTVAPEPAAKTETVSTSGIPANTSSRTPIREGIQAASNEANATPAPTRKSIAVLPFANRSTDAGESQFFSDGIHDDLLTHLSKINDLKVISRTSVMSYRDTQKNMRQIGQELGVATLLEGGVQRAGKRVRINAQLIDAQTDEHLWAEIFDRELTTENIFDIQQEISLAIAAALEAELSPQEQEELATVPTHDLVAYEQWLTARQYTYRSTVDSMQTGSQMLQGVIARDPGFGLAYVDLAFAEVTLVLTGAQTVEEARERVEATLAKALELNPDNGSVWAGRGSWAQLNGQESVADEMFQKALELSPNNSDVRFIYGYHLVKTKSRPDLALPILERAAELDPLFGSVLFTLGRAYEGLERFEEARATFARIRSIEPESVMGFAPMAGLALSEGQLTESLDWTQKAIEHDPLDVELKALQALQLMSLGDLDEANIPLEVAEKGAGQNQPLPMAARVIWNAMSGRFEASAELARYMVTAALPDRWGSDAIALRALRNQAISSGNVADALAAYRQRHPALFASEPEISAQNIMQAIDLSSLLQAVGKTEQAKTLQQAAVEAYDQPYFATGGYTMWIVSAKAQALALLGRKDEAIAELQRIVQKGWRMGWQWETDLNPNFDSLRGDPRYQAIVDFLRDDAEAQRQEYLEQQT